MTVSGWVAQSAKTLLRPASQGLLAASTTLAGCGGSDGSEGDGRNSSAESLGSGGADANGAPTGGVLEGMGGGSGGSPAAFGVGGVTDVAGSGGTAMGGMPGGAGLGGSTLGAGGTAAADSAAGHPPGSAGGGTSGAGALALAGAAGSTPAFELLGSPLPFSPTSAGFGLSAALSAGSPEDLRVRLRLEGAAAWGDLREPEVPAADLAQWLLEGLGPSTRYEYEVVALDLDQELVLHSGSVVTQRAAGETYTFALLADSHIGADLDYYNQGDEEILRLVSTEIGAASPDFMVNLGDMLDFHQYGFNDPPPDGAATRAAYLNYRLSLGDTLGHVSHYAVIGNWEGENGCYTPEEIARSREQRLLYMPGPEPTTYPEGGSPAEDYYAFTWGDALFLVLNVMSYTPTEHLLETYPGVPDDWTLGPEQLDWLGDTLANATSKWRFLLIHHTVGGAAGDEVNAAYGRGGGQAANVGEQAVVHQLMRDHGVQVFFYAHDHVFTDMVVDDIHYSMPGSAGAIWMFTGAETGYEESWLEPGWGLVHVSPDAVHVEFVALGGEVLLDYTLE